uniref:Uncharacterized protein n=1 Tax=Anguilla anguilla TaxID=7936 RepID=A0A0E9UFX0_ANGAN
MSETALSSKQVVNFILYTTYKHFHG